MKSSILTLALFSALLGCGSETQTEETTQLVNPPLAFTQVASSSALTQGSIADHLVFSSEIPVQEVSMLKADFKYAESWDGLASTSQKSTLERLLGTGNSTPANVSLWFKSRVKYLLGKSIGNAQIGLVYGSDRLVGLQVLGESDVDTDDSTTGGANLGTSIYLTTLDEQKTRPDLSYIIMRVNDLWVPILSPSVGLIQIGPALFDAGATVNPSNPRAIANTIQRLEVLFHEARHSDGNSQRGSTGFTHVECPNNGQISDELVGIPACDDTNNGAYTVGAAILDVMTSFCQRTARCTEGEQVNLEALRIDRLPRVIGSGAGAPTKTFDPSPEPGFTGLNMSDFGAFLLR